MMLGNEKIMAFVGVSDANKARAFYRDTLGLTMLYEDNFALVFDVNGVMLRVTLVGEVRPQPYTVLGWQVNDAVTTARTLSNAGVKIDRYPHVQQDEDGIWTAPGGAKIAWFKDPDGNILSIAQM
ncbi:VOC family protein [Alloacidobacterium dinghuense]|uniref:VOC family protein n=2 Tax=Alloacidobacterium dinghuense TaxID=2763107 RepID=A0A7G8BMY4_9BACT|nr:VOC family protein [Alloacidobacterium dinghuense]